MGQRFHCIQGCGVGGFEDWIQEGIHSEEEAQKLTLANPKACGYVKWAAGHFCIAPVGAEKLVTRECDFFYPLVENLPPGAHLEKDDFTDGDQAATLAGYDLRRPGRKEGLGDDRHLALYTTVSPTDLVQGNLGDCWLISALAVFAEFPKAFHDLIKPNHLSSSGFYEVNLYSHTDQKRRKVKVDDRLPANALDECAYTQISMDGEIWPCIVEKAFAKLLGSYGNLNGGISIFAFGVLTGCFDLVLLSPQLDSNGTATGRWMEEAWKWQEDRQDDERKVSQKLLATHSPEEVWELLVSFSSRNFMLAAGSTATAERESIDNLGIVHGHAYSMLNVKKELNGDDGKLYDLLQLRNPWGNQEWNGDWSDGSPLWQANPSIQKECGWMKKEDGLFWMSWQDFQTEYGAIYVCKKDMGPNRSKIKQAANIAQGNCLHMVEKRRAKHGEAKSKKG